LGHSRYRSGLHTVIESFAWSYIPLRFGWAARVVVRLVIELPVRPFDPPRHPAAIGRRELFSRWRGKRKGRKLATTKVVARFRDAPAGPPTSWIPPCIPPFISPGRARSNRPTSLWRGEARVSVDSRNLERAGAVNGEGGSGRRRTNPTSTTING